TVHPDSEPRVYVAEIGEAAARIAQIDGAKDFLSCSTSDATRRPCPDEIPVPTKLQPPITPGTTKEELVKYLRAATPIRPGVKSRIRRALSDDRLVIENGLADGLRETAVENLDTICMKAGDSKNFREAAWAAPQSYARSIESCAFTRHPIPHIMQSALGPQLS